MRKGRKAIQAEARALLWEHLAAYREWPYARLAAAAREKLVDAPEAVGSSGTRYGLEFLFVWDDEPESDVRVIGMADTLPLRPLFGFLPIYVSDGANDSFIVRPDGTFVGE